jgi:hypothetical protein
VKTAPPTGVSGRWVGLLIASVLLSGCGGVQWVGRGARGSYRLDSATLGCRQNPALCVQSTESVPRATASVGRTAITAASATGVTTAATLWTLDEALSRRITQEIEKCADAARSAVLLQRNFDKTPTPEQCRAQALDSRGNLIWDPQGKPMTLARQLGKEMHDLASQCVQARLSAIIPGKFALEPRYRYDRKSKTTTFISPEEEQALLRAGGENLKGTLKPDLVLHTGNPLETFAVYDFKFPCADLTDKGWPIRDGQILSQGELYKEAFRGRIYRVLPWIGAIQ